MEAYEQTRPCSICRREIFLQNYELHQIKCEKQGISRIKLPNEIPIRPVVSVLQKLEEPKPNAIKEPSRLSMLRSSLALRSSVSREEPINCPQCCAALTLEELDSHKKTCEAKLKKCEYCDEQFLEILMPDHEEVCTSKKMLQRIKKEDQQEFKSFEGGNSEEEEYERRLAPPSRGSSNRNSSRNSSNNSYRSARSNGRDQGPLGAFTALFDLGRRNEISQLISNLISNRSINTHSTHDEGLSSDELTNLNRRKYRKRRQEDLCTICYCNLEEGQEVIQLQCLHLYHDDCLVKWLEQSSKCPVCKHDVKEQ